MHIQDPVLVIDEGYADHLNIQELLDGGVVSVIAGVYKGKWDGKKYAMWPNSKRIMDQVANDGRLVLQTYYYYYPELDPIVESDWFLNAMAGYPVMYAWADLEQHDHPMTPLYRSEQNRKFCAEMHMHFPQSGVYTNNAYVGGFASAMNEWLPLYPSWVAEYGHQPKTATMMDWATLRSNWLPDYDIILAPGQTISTVYGHQFTGNVDMLPGIYDNGMTWNAILHKNRMTDDVSVFSAAFIKSISGTKSATSLPAHIVPTQIPVQAYPAYKILVSVNPNVHETSDPLSRVDGYIISATAPVLYVDAPDPTTGYSHILPIPQFPKGGWIKTAYLVRT